MPMESPHCRDLSCSLALTNMAHERQMIQVCECKSIIKTSLCVSPQQHEADLLPEVEAQDQGKICVVIDLDETLVHSSFKVPRVIFLYIISCLTTQFVVLFHFELKLLLSK